MTQKERKDPSFLTDHQSVASLIGQLHEYFKDACSHYEIERSHTASQLHAHQDEQKTQELMATLRRIDTEISLFAVVSDALSIADRVLHTRSTITELGLDNEVYRMHYDSPKQTPEK
ncbi:MAG: hypothetical protein KME15_09520 [Drouetiella hepatica Uher 2000/2452]|jgi:hypothetical protein|uniref:Uncharacterized protein n=1 Tax=Drouetiella hepatica Uher 2000/2452 TaxID=904376 RepID=A0A951Q8Y7_9CYAN|nr:hypothetical protein [Drouetiella hepatica Uher 2000/2452]